MNATEQLTSESLQINDDNVVEIPTTLLYFMLKEHTVWNRLNGTIDGPDLEGATEETLRVSMEIRNLVMQAIELWKERCPEAVEQAESGIDINEDDIAFLEKVLGVSNLLSMAPQWRGQEGIYGVLTGGAAGVGGAARYSVTGYPDPTIAEMGLNDPERRNAARQWMESAGNRVTIDVDPSNIKKNEDGSITITLTTKDTAEDTGGNHDTGRTQGKTDLSWRYRTVERKL